MGNSGSAICQSFGFGPARTDATTVTKAQLDELLNMQRRLERKLIASNEAQAQATAQAVDSLSRQIDNYNNLQATNSTALAVALEASSIRAIEKCFTHTVVGSAACTASQRGLPLSSVTTILMPGQNPALSRWGWPVWHCHAVA